VATKNLEKKRMFWMDVRVLRMAAFVVFTSHSVASSALQIEVQDVIESGGD
jgi:hypothetical protein